ncbi:MAG: isoprenylcysteine carboxylmethyltransferase family protein [Phycisphaerae bacterium]|jgi:protein-S-isoprenylcysteine O-methyltransferase Ste14
MSYINNLIEFLVGRSKIEHSILVRIVTLLIGAAVFMVGMPLAVYGGGCLFKGYLPVPQAVSTIVYIICFAIGTPWSLSAVFWQLIFGKGTPIPAVPTRQLLQSGPYRYVRNPMMGGYFLYLLGWAFLFNKMGNFLVVIVFMILLILEIKFIEEPELEKRFGDAYREYKKENPFLLPRWVKK